MGRPQRLRLVRRGRALPAAVASGIANLDLYAQGGVVGFESRDLFFDGAATFTRPVWKNWSAGLGVWGGAQPGTLPASTPGRA